jgi:hypothetical protein
MRSRAGVAILAEYALAHLVIRPIGRSQLGVPQPSQPKRGRASERMASLIEYHLKWSELKYSDGEIPANHLVLGNSAEPRQRLLRRASSNHRA